MNVLVTGGAGYVGSHACRALKAAGLTPVAYDNLSRGFRSLVRYGPLEEGDILDRPRLLEVFARYRPRAVMHFAALAYVGELVEAPLDYYRNNTAGALSLLDAMRQCGVDRLVFSRTCAVYGAPAIQPMTEDLPLSPINPYGWSKRMVEQALQDSSAAYGLRSASLRYFNASGAAPCGKIGELHQPETHLVPRALMAARGRSARSRCLVRIIPRRTARPFAIMCMSATSRTRTSPLCVTSRRRGRRCLDLGAGRGYSVREVLDAASRVTGRPIPQRLAARRPGDPPRLIADATAATRLLNFAPQWRDIDAIVASAWEWHRSRGASPAENRSASATPA